MQNYSTRRLSNNRCGFTALIFCLIIGTTVSAQQAYQKPALEKEKSWTLIMVPDLQNYSKWSRNQPIMDLMMAWIVDNIDTLNIKMVMGVGDLVENDEKITNDNDGDQTTQSQWQTVSKAFGRLDGKVPYIAATGNHDYSIDREGNRSFPFQRIFFYRAESPQSKITGAEYPQRTG